MSKNLLTILALLLLLLAFVYPYLSGSQPEVAAAPASQGSAILSQLEGVSFDFSVLQNQTLQQLKDWTLAPLDLPVGKSNPFK